MRRTACRTSGFGPISRIRCGVTLIEVVVVIFLIGLLVSLIVPAVQQARDAASRAQCRNNLRQIGLACHNMQSATGRFPSIGRVYPPDNWGFSSLFQLLPYIEQGTLQSSFDTNTHAASANNLAVINDSYVAIWHCASDPMQSRQITNYFGNCGTGYEVDLEAKDDGFLSLPDGTRPSDFLDGLSNTVAFAECAGSVKQDSPRRSIVDIAHEPESWEEFLLFSDDCMKLTRVSDLGPRVLRRYPGSIWTQPGLGSSRYNHVFPPGSNSCASGGSNRVAIVTPDSWHSSGVTTLFADGSVRITRMTIDREVWVSLGSRGEY
jgi:prepilin-type N-terminal cleavage/methylation domain-containing protein/prepilin-type processing-associated H-X9-DG protein